MQLFEFLIGAISSVMLTMTSLLPFPTGRNSAEVYNFSEDTLRNLGSSLHRDTDVLGTLAQWVTELLFSFLAMVLNYCSLPYMHLRRT
jgi:hypothetical protein